MESFWPIFWSAVGTALTALFAWLTTVITNAINNNVKDKKNANHLNAINLIVLNAVQNIFQSFVDTMKKNGKFDEEAQKEAKERALTIIKSQLTPELKDYIVSNFSDIEEYLKTKIEATIYQLKK